MVVYGDGGMHEFTTYFDLTDAEKAFIFDHPLVAWDFYQAAQSAAAEAASRFPKSSLGRGRGDAYRHALWSARMTRAHGAALAKEFGDAHEDFPGNPALDRAMDLHNNGVGRGIGATYRGPLSLADRVMTEMSAGTLRTSP